VSADFVTIDGKYRNVAANAPAPIDKFSGAAKIRPATIGCDATYGRSSALNGVIDISLSATREGMGGSLSRSKIARIFFGVVVVTAILD